MSQNVAKKDNPPSQTQSPNNQTNDTESNILSPRNSFNDEYDEAKLKRRLYMRSNEVEISVFVLSKLTNSLYQSLFCLNVDKKILPSNLTNFLNKKRKKEEDYNEIIRKGKKENKKNNPNVEIVCNNGVIILNKHIFKESNKNVIISKDFGNIQIMKTILSKDTLKEIFKKVTEKGTNKKAQNLTKNNPHHKDIKQITKNNNNMNFSKPINIAKLLSNTSIFLHKGAPKLKDILLKPTIQEPEQQIKIEKIDLDEADIVPPEKNKIENEKKEISDEKIKMQEIQNQLIKQNITDEEEGPITYDFKVIQGRSTSIQLFDTDIQTLGDGRYLNDKIIMFYLR
jgi:hypothetical protein